MLRYVVTGDREAVEFFKRAPQALKAAAMKGVTKATLYLEGMAKRIVYAGHPEHLEGDTGHLRRSITHRLDETRLEGETGTNVVYGPVHEYGATIRPVQASMLHWVDKASGADVFAMESVIPPRPFMGPAFEEGQEGAGKLIENAIYEYIGP